MNRPVFITIEGADGSGKTACLSVLHDEVKRLFKSDCIKTREPGGTPSAEKIREAMINECRADPLLPISQFLLMQASRYQHVFRTIYPQLSAGVNVVSSRYFDSTVVLQGRLQHIGEYLERFRDVAEHSFLHIRPDLTILLDISAENAIERVVKEDALDDRFSDPQLDVPSLWRQHFNDLRRHAQVWSGESRIEVVDANQPLYVVLDEIRRIVKDQADYMRTRPSNIPTYFEKLDQWVKKNNPLE